MTLTKEQRIAKAKLELEWLVKPFPVQYKYIENGEWYDTEEEPKWFHDLLYRRKPEPTLEEQNAECRKQWEAMTPTDDPAFRINANGRKCRVEWRFQSNPEWKPNDEFSRSADERVQWGLKAARPFHFRIVELPEPKVVPWRNGEGVGRVVRHKGEGRTNIITGFWGGAYDMPSWGRVTPEVVADMWVQLDGKPCGEVQHEG